MPRRVVAALAVVTGAAVERALVVERASISTLPVSIDTDRAHEARCRAVSHTRGVRPLTRKRGATGTGTSNPDATHARSAASPAGSARTHRAGYSDR